MNKHDAERVVGILDSMGASHVESIEEADIVLFLTCCVREAADTRLYGQVATMRTVPLRDACPVSKRIVAVGGCIGQRDGIQLIERLPHVDIVFGTQTIAFLPQLLCKVLRGEGPCVSVAESQEGFTSDLPTVREQFWSAWLPITSGCDNFCTYCVVPYVRGREKSRTMESILDEACDYLAQGVKEITLLGQNVNSYGRDLYGSPRFAELLRELDKIGDFRLRFATSHPKDLSDEVIDAFRSLHNLMPALHLPVQSGSNRVLEAMNRRYTREHYLGLIEKLRMACPEIALSTDIIVGFPTETDDDFEDTYRLVDEVGYQQVFTFIYSKREGTPAASMENCSTPNQIQARFDRLVDLVQKKAYEANQRELGRDLEVLVEGASKRDQNIISGRSAGNLTVHAPLPDGSNIDSLVGSFVTVHVDTARTWYLQGTIVDGVRDADVGGDPTSVVNEDPSLCSDVRAVEEDGVL